MIVARYIKPKKDCGALRRNPFWVLRRWGAKRLISFLGFDLVYTGFEV
ncbi:hypothetical protein APA_5255 [Pseudanabaena sp. lw0831]|nr:hypothetical protein APA_5255 [Pseudanabaena sp. lw0831]